VTEIDVLYEDSETLVINKPVDVVVNRAESIKGETVQDWVEGQGWYEKLKNSKNQKLKESKNQNIDDLYRQRSGVCHRLDKETSGCLMVAKTPAALEYYLGLFKSRQIVKSYIALVHGRVGPDEGEVVLPLKRSLYDREKWQVHYEGKKAVTTWKVEERFNHPGHEHWNDSLSWLRLNLKTGRTHQIRVHMAFLGWPIFSDYKYLNRKFAREDRRYLSHHFLHAEQIEFVSMTGVPVLVKAPLPEDAQKFLSSLRVLE